jgi:hypothetical protein
MKSPRPRDDQLHADRRGEAAVGAPYQLIDELLVERRALHQGGHRGREQMLDVPALSGTEVIKDEYLVAPRRERVGEVRPNESGTACD